MDNILFSRKKEELFVCGTCEHTLKGAEEAVCFGGYRPDCPRIQAQMAKEKEITAERRQRHFDQVCRDYVPGAQD